MRVNGWVRAKASTQAAWFCPKCKDKWTQKAGSARRWILLWKKALKFDKASDKLAADPVLPHRHGSAQNGGKAGNAASKQAAGKPRTWKDVQQAKGRPIIYKYEDHSQCPDGNF
eukprot:2615506-Amphidinium_carterae.1